MTANVTAKEKRIRAAVFRMADLNPPVEAKFRRNFIVPDGFERSRYAF
jgi:hypothetical protein